MSSIIRYVKQEIEIKADRERPCEIIDELEDDLFSGRSRKLEKAELLGVLAFGCVETEKAAWEILNHSATESTERLLESIAEAEQENLSESKSTRILATVELLRRLRAGDLG